jgi:hypothetical protein
MVEKCCGVHYEQTVRGRREFGHTGGTLLPNRNRGGSRVGGGGGCLSVHTLQVIERTPQRFCSATSHVCGGVAERSGANNVRCIV